MRPGDRCTRRADSRAGLDHEVDIADSKAWSLASKMRMPTAARCPYIEPTPSIPTVPEATWTAQEIARGKAIADTFRDVITDASPPSPSKRAAGEAPECRGFDAPEGYVLADDAPCAAGRRIVSPSKRAAGEAVPPVQLCAVHGQPWPCEHLIVCGPTRATGEPEAMRSPGELTTVELMRYAADIVEATTGMARRSTMGSDVCSKLTCPNEDEVAHLRTALATAERERDEAKDFVVLANKNYARVRAKLEAAEWREGEYKKDETRLTVQLATARKALEDIASEPAMTLMDSTKAALYDKVRGIARRALPSNTRTEGER